MTVREPRRASTVVLLKPSARRFDVCLVRRHDEVAFMGGACVFPGGALDAADRVGASSDFTFEVPLLSGLSLEETRAHYRGAVRELLEEAGIRITRPETLVPFAHWTTPEIEAKRYDVRFFMTVAPEGQELTADKHEMTE